LISQNNKNIIMKHYFLILIAVLLSQFGFAQEVGPKTESETQDAVYNVSGIESKPEFNGGISGFYKYISENFKAPTDRKFKGGKVIASFVIEKDGAVTEIKILKECGFGTGEETKRVLSECPKWTPGQQNGQAVRVQYAIPINLPGN
jgi:protein TonB